MSSAHSPRRGNAAGRVVHGYRIYIIGSDGHIKDRVDVFCEDEDDAKQRAEQLVDGRAVELWDGARHIARFEPKH